MNAIDHALHYAGEYRLPVFPCRPDKRPYTASGFKDATTDPARIAEWWQRWPSALIGLPTGATSGLVVLDLDRSKNGTPDGFEWLHDFEETHGRLPETMVATTPSGGEHHYFELPEGLTVPTSAGTVAPNVDVRGDGGYVIAPGSTNGVGAWEWVDVDAHPVALPPELARELASTGPHASAPWTPLESDDVDPALVAALDELTARGGHHPVLHEPADRGPWIEVTRPGKLAGASATVGYVGRGAVKVFSSNWPGLPAGTYAVDELVAARAEGRPARDREQVWSDHVAGPVPTVVHDDDDVESWVPVDLGPAVRGEKRSPVPTVFTRDDGRHLLYQGRINYLHGDSGSGKTWVAALAAKQELKAGRRVLWLDFEDPDETALVERLQKLSVPGELILEHLVYVNPDTPPTTAALVRLAELIAEHEVRLCVVDSVGEAFGVIGLNEDKDVEVAPWFRQVLRPLAAAGAAVLPIDHSTKAGDNPLFPSGSKRKRAAISGAGYLVDAPESFATDKSGLIRLTTAKDRHGAFARGETAGLLPVTPEPDGGVGIRLIAPPVALADSAARAAQLAAAAVEAVAVLESAGEPLSGRELMSRLAMKCRAEVKRAAIDAAVRVGAIETETGPRGAVLHRFVQSLSDADLERIGPRP